MTQQAIMITIVYAKDASEGTFAFLREMSNIQVIQRSEWVNYCLLCFEKNFIYS